MPYTHTYLGPGYKVEREGVTSYTFGIISLEEEYYKTPKSYYENLVVVEDSEGTRGFVMRYAIETDEPIEWEPVFGKNIQSYPCGEVSVVGIYPCICAGHFPGDPSCTCGTKGYVQEFTQGVPCGAVYVTEDGEKGGGFNIGGTPSGTSGGGSTNPSGWYGYPQYIPGNDYTNENFTQEPFTQIPEPKLIDDYTAAKITFIAGTLGLSEEAENWLITSGNKASVTTLINKLFAKLLSPLHTEESKAAFREVINFAIENHFSPEAMEFANEAVNIISEHPSFNMDVSRSFKSPYNIDLTSVTPNATNPEPEKVRFINIYDKLTNTSLFKNIFQATFGQNPNLNVSFEIADNLPSTQNPTKQANGHTDLVNGTYNNTTNSINTVNIVIRINKQALVGGINLPKASNITVARTILHETIHAFLTLKKLDSNAGATLPNINNKDLSMMINDMYNNFNSPNSDQHSFMFNHLVPTLASNLAVVKDDMIPQNEQNSAESLDFGGTHNGLTVPPTPFNWNDFFYYYSMEGLHHTQTFDDEIKSDDIEFHIYGRYITVGRSFSKN